MSAKGDSLKTIIFALGANFAIFLSKLVAAVLTGSGSKVGRDTKSTPRH